MSFSPDGTRIVTGSWDQTAKVWDVRTGALLLDLKGHTDPVGSVAFSPTARASSPAARTTRRRCGTLRPVCCCSI